MPVLIWGAWDTPMNKIACLEELFGWLFIFFRLRIFPYIMFIRVFCLFLSWMCWIFSCIFFSDIIEMIFFSQSVKIVINIYRFSNIKSSLHFQDRYNLIAMYCFFTHNFLENIILIIFIHVWDRFCSFLFTFLI